MPVDALTLKHKQDIKYIPFDLRPQPSNTSSIASICTFLSFYLKTHAQQDIKLENLLLDPYGCVKIADFGVAVAGSLGSRALGSGLQVFRALGFIGP